MHSDIACGENIWTSQTEQFDAASISSYLEKCGQLTVLTTLQPACIRDYSKCWKCFQLPCTHFCQTYKRCTFTYLSWKIE